VARTLSGPRRQRCVCGVQERSTCFYVRELRALV
jgi:hypothetical protein